MKQTFFPFALAILSLLSLGTFPASAQNEINIQRDIEIPGRVKPIPIAMSGFSGEVASVLRFDLEIQGFKVVEPDAAQFLVSGSNSGNVQGNVTDRVNKATLLSKGYTGASLRKPAHAFADDVVLAITKRKGIGQTKIAFKVDTGRTSELYMTDFDGHNAQVVTKDNSIVAAPAWVPGRMALYYTSYKLGSPFIFHHNLASGERNVVARFSGLNTSAAVSSDGRKVAMILSKSGSPDVYVCDADGGNLKQLTATRQDESSPCWSPDGQWICFATKLNERRVLAKVPASGGAIQRITTAGALNPTEPDWSPDGKWIVFTSMGRYFSICVVPAAGGSVEVLADGEDPSWSPNSRTVIFARRAGNGRTLSLLDVFTKQTKDVARISGSNSQPSWAK